MVSKSRLKIFCILIRFLLKATEDFTPSFTSEHLSRIPDDDTDGEDILMYAAASMYSGVFYH